MVCPESATDNGWPTSFPFTVAIDFGLVGVELVDVTAKSTLTGGNRTWTISRGIDFTTASTHANNAVVRHVIAARDFTEARQARSLQPADGVNTYIIAEVTNSGEWTDTLVGDLVVKAAAGKAIHMGNDALSTSTFSVGPSSTRFNGNPVQINAGMGVGSGPDVTDVWQTSTGGTWTGSTTSPTHYSVTTRYVFFGHLLFFSTVYTAITSFTAGSGSYTFTIGVPSQAAVDGQVCVGYYDVTGTGTTRTVVAGLLATGTGVVISRTVANGTSLGISATSQTWQVGSVFKFSGVIELA